jgi:hypothetical protein
VLGFDEKYGLLGILTLRDIVRGLGGDFLGGPGGVELSWKDLVGPELTKHSPKQVSEVMSPFKVNVAGNDGAPSIMCLPVRTDFA